MVRIQSKLHVVSCTTPSRSLTTRRHRFFSVFFKMLVSFKYNPGIKSNNEWLQGIPSSARRVDLTGCAIGSIEDGSFSHLGETTVKATAFQDNKRLAVLLL